MERLTVARVKVKTGKDVASELFHWSHSKNSACVGCGKDCGRAAIVSLVYTFEECSCDQVEYVHLVERLWHRKCFKESSRA